MINRSKERSTPVRKSPVRTREPTRIKETTTTLTLSIGLSDTLDPVFASGMCCDGTDAVRRMIQPSTSASTTYLSTLLTPISVDSTNREGKNLNLNSLKNDFQHSPPSPLFPTVNNTRRASAVKPSRKGHSFAVLKKLPAHLLAAFPPTGFELSCPRVWNFPAHGFETFPPTGSEQ